MSESKRIKIVADIFDDKKILILETLPGGESIIYLWLKLLAKADKKNEDGSLEFKIADIDLTNDILKTVFRYKGNSIEQALRSLEDFGLIERNQKSIVLLPFWIDERDRSSTRYKKWRQAVFKRDNYTCQHCGSKKNLQAHHIIPWSETRNEQNLRYSVANGITLCRTCHLKAHNGRWYK